MADLDFVKDRQCVDLRDTQYFSGVCEFWDLNEHDIPETPGAYILIGRLGTRFLYPRGTNRVYYIGQTQNLHRRLNEHFHYALEARNNRQIPLYSRRYEYAANFGTHYGYVNTWQGLTPVALEEILMAHFAQKHRAFPIANSAGVWGRIDHYL